MSEKFVIKAPPYEEIIKIAKSKGYTPIQAETLAQLYALNPLFRYAYGVEAILNIENGYGIRLHTRNGEKIINIDIIYRPVPDLYEIKAYRLTNHGLDIQQIADIKDVFFMDLKTYFKAILTDQNKQNYAP